jgi:hypothetical protein
MNIVVPMKENDFLYISIQMNSVGIYQVTGEFHFTIKMVSKCSRDMYRYPTHQKKTINKIENNPVLAEKIHDIICSKIELYFTQTV